MLSDKDSAEVIQFRALLNELKDCTDDDPDWLSDHYPKDDSLARICRELYAIACVLKRTERDKRELFAAPVDPKFLLEWRDFESRFERVVGSIALSTTGLLYEADQEIAQLQAGHAAYFIELAFEFAAHASSDESFAGADYSEDLSCTVQEGVGLSIQYWENLKDDIGLDLEGIFRRRNLVPFVFIPREIAARYGDSDRLSTLMILRDAHECFIYGKYTASFSLMRSVVEAVLRDHYGAEGKDLKDRIDRVGFNLPRMANKAALHRLRRIANKILHLDIEEGEGLLNFDPMQQEKDVLSLLYVVRSLIEGAPPRRARS